MGGEAVLWCTWAAEAAARAAGLAREIWGQVEVEGGWAVKERRLVVLRQAQPVLQLLPMTAAAVITTPAHWLD